MLATVLIIVSASRSPPSLIVRAFGYPNRTALTISASLAQIGEFSFILAALGVELGLLPEDGRDLILAGAIISIMRQPAVLRSHRLDWPSRRRAGAATATDSTDEALAPTALTGHAVVIGYGRVGSAVGDALSRPGMPFLVIEDEPRPVEVAARSAASRRSSATPPTARCSRRRISPARRYLFVAIPEAFEAGQIVAPGPCRQPGPRSSSPAPIPMPRSSISRRLGADRRSIMGEREIARGMVSYVFDRKEAPGPVG